MSGYSRKSAGRKTARVLMAVVFALGVIVGPTGALAVTPTTMYSPLIPQRVSVASDGTQANDLSDQGVISDDGRYVSFVTGKSLVATDTNGDPGIEHLGTGIDTYVRTCRRVFSYSAISPATDLIPATATWKPS